MITWYRNVPVFLVFLVRYCIDDEATCLSFLLREGVRRYLINGSLHNWNIIIFFYLTQHRTIANQKKHKK